MVDSKSITKVVEFIKRQKEFVTLTQIRKDTGLSFKTIKGCIETLESLDLIEKITNGRIVFVKFCGLIGMREITDFLPYWQIELKRIIESNNGKVKSQTT